MEGDWDEGCSVGERVAAEQGCSAMWRALVRGYEAEPRLLVVAFGLSLLAALPDALIALWLKLIADGVLDGRGDQRLDVLHPFRTLARVGLLQVLGVAEFFDRCLCDLKHLQIGITRVFQKPFKIVINRCNRIRQIVQLLEFRRLVAT